MHYELYIDLFLENFMMDSLLLFVTERITGGKYSFKGVLSGAFLGSVLTCLMVVVSVPAWMKNIAFYLVIPFCMLWLKIGNNVCFRYSKEWDCFTFWECSWGHVDDVSSLSALYQSVLWDCGA